MRASDRHRIGALLLVALTLLLAGARRPAPGVGGAPDDAVRTVRDALEGRPAAEVRVWVERAWRALEADGWPRARVRVDTTAAGAAWELLVQGGPRTRLGSLELRGPDPEVIRLWEDAARLREGDPLFASRFEERLREGLRAVSDAGYPLASVTVVGQDHDPVTGEMDLVLLVRPGPRARIRDVLVDGAVRTRPEVLVRLSGLREGDWVQERSLETARRRLQARPGLVESVLPFEVLRVPGEPELVDLRMRVEQEPRAGSFSGALGARQRPDGSTELSGSVDLALADLFGTARAFRGRWRDDGRGRNQLDLSWLEPMVMGSAFDLRLALGQRHEDDGYDMVLGDLALLLAPRPGLQLGVTGGLDRTTFSGESGRSRRRNRAGISLGLFWDRGRGGGAFGRFGTDVQAAFVSDRRRDPDDPETRTVDASVRHSLVQADGRAGWAFSRTIAVEAHGGWRSTENAPLPLPRSEQWGIGGATTVRGHAEDRYFGERIAFGGAELVFGPPRAGQAYLFLDAGWVRTTSDEAGVPVTVENRLQGFGLGVRAPTALGAIDLSLGFADELNFDEGKLHVSLVQRF